MSYTYDPTQINDGGLNQLRFELGDCLVTEAEKTAYLTDEELMAVIGSTRSWKHALFRCVETLLMRFAYEVNVEVREAKWELTERVAFWKDLHKRLKAELEAEEMATALGLNVRRMRPAIFKVGMQDVHATARGI